MLKLYLMVSYMLQLLFNSCIEAQNVLDDNNNPDINITDVALHISTYGTEEFKQLLELMQIENENDLSCCRPLKVVNYIRVGTLLFIFNYNYDIKMD